MMEKRTRPHTTPPREALFSTLRGMGDRSMLGEALRFGAILRRRLLPTAAVFVVMLGAVTFVGLRQPKLYRTTSILHVADTTPNILQDVGDVYSLGTVNPYEFPRYMETQAKIIRGREISGQVVDALGLAEDLGFLGLDEDLDAEELAEALTVVDPVEVLQEITSTEQVEESNLLRIICVDSDAARAAQIVNTIADTFIAYNVSQRDDATESAVAWLDEQVTDVNKNVEQLEQRLMDFREGRTFMGASVEDAIAINAKMIEDLTAAATQLKLDRLSKEARWTGAVELDQGEIEAIPELVADPVVQEIRKELMQVHRERADLAARYGERHPSMDDLDKPEQDLLSLMEQEVGTIVESERRGIHALAVEERSVLASLASEQDRAVELSRMQLEYERLERELDQQSDLLEMLETRFQEARLAEQLSTNNITVIEYSPVPMDPFRPRLSFVGLMALLIASILSLTTAVMADRLDSKIRSQAQIEQEFGLRVLGIQPAFKPNGETRKIDDKKGRPRVELYSAQAPQSRFAECLRAIRTNLMFLASDQPMRSILISSSKVGEGKTSVATNLALTLAASGQKTLLVDADLRSPSLATVFGARPEQGKLTELLIGEVQLEDALHHPDHENLDVLLAGHPPTNPAELLGSQQFRDLLVELVKRYDRVVIDSPPVGPVTDSKLLSQVVDVMVMVVRQNVSDRFSLNHTLRQLRDVEADILGCVLNSADLDRDKYGYGYGYGNTES